MKHANAKPAQASFGLSFLYKSHVGQKKKFCERVQTFSFQILPSNPNFHSDHNYGNISSFVREAPFELVLY